MKKLKVCPECGWDHLSTKWVAGRKLAQYCQNGDCYWQGNPFTPTRKPIHNFKECRVDDCPGWDYIVYDKYGHVAVISCSYGTRTEALADMRRDIAYSPKTDPAAPYTGVLFKTPDFVKIVGKVFKAKKNENE